MNLRTDYSDVHFKENGKLKLLIIVGTRPEIIRGGHIIYTGRKDLNTRREHFQY